MSFTFAKALGGKIGNSIHEDSMLDEVNEIIKIAKKAQILTLELEFLVARVGF